MSIPRAYLPFLESHKLGQLVLLPKEVVAHLIGALRLKNGDAVIAFNGQGGSYSACLVRDKNQWLIKLLSSKEDEQIKIPHITLLQALSTGERMDWIVQKATELGVAHIVPIAAKRSVLKLTGERAMRRLEHWKNILIASCEQCGRNTIPWLSPPVSLDVALQNLDDHASLKLFLYPEGDCTLSQLPTQWPHSVTLAIGPEGDWDDAEVAAAQLAGFHKLRLGTRIMRTDTAAVAAVCATLTRWGDFNNSQRSISLPF